MLLTEFAGPDAHAAVIENVDSSWTKRAHRRPRPLRNPSVNGKVLPGFFSKLGTLD
jgi:hypothetical protein